MGLSGSNTRRRTSNFRAPSSSWCAISTRSGPAQVVSVANPDFAHVEPVMTKLEAGKHVVVEKPLATITAAAEAMVRAAREKA